MYGLSELLDTLVQGASLSCMDISQGMLKYILNTHK